MLVFNGSDVARIKIKDKIEPFTQSIWEESPAAALDSHR